MDEMDEERYADLLALVRDLVWTLYPQRHWRGWTDEMREDLVQEVVAKYLASWPEGTRPKNEAAWLTVAIRNAARDSARREGRRPQPARAKEDPVAELLDGVAGGPAASMMGMQEAMLGQVFALVPEADAELLRLRYVEQVAPAEIAESLGVSPNTLDQRLSRARKRLAEALQEQPELLAELRAPHPRVYPDPDR